MPFGADTESKLRPSSTRLVTRLSRLWRYGRSMNRVERSQELLVAVVLGAAVLLFGVVGSQHQGTQVRAKSLPGVMSSQLRDPVMPLPSITSTR